MCNNLLLICISQEKQYCVDAFLCEFKKLKMFSCAWNSLTLPSFYSALEQVPMKIHWLKCVGTRRMDRQADILGYV